MFWPVHALQSDASTSSINQLSAYLRDIAVKHFPSVAEARYAEWWAHCRCHPSGHQFHFDSDDEGQGGIRNPIISTVVYLTGKASGTRFNLCAPFIVKMSRVGNGMQCCCVCFSAIVEP